MSTTALNTDQFLLTEFEQEFLQKLRERKAQLAANITKLKDEINSIKNELSCFDLDDKHILEKFNKGKFLFNETPEKGIDFLIDNNLLINDSAAIARFLFNSNGLSKKSIGNYLGKNDEFNKSVLKDYINQQNFKDVLLIDALRLFLKRFLIPSESQIIDRFMQQFACRYTHQNPAIFSSEDDCYILCFGIIMLNTLMHNPQVQSKYKPTIKRFIQDHPNVNRELLIEFYENIKQNAFEMPQDDYNEEILGKSVKEGWLMKQSRFGSHWDRRWFVLNNRCLYYFMHPSDNEPKGIIPLENVRVRESNEKGHGFEIHSILGQNKSIKACKRALDGRIIITKHLTYKFITKDFKEGKDWFIALKQNISHNPYYDLLEARKKKFNRNRSLNLSIDILKKTVIFVKKDFSF